MLRAERERGRLVVEVKQGAVSLGWFVFWSQRSNRYIVLCDENRRHELGHAAQSRRLGPLYLPLVGLPSSLRASWLVLHRELKGERWLGYYDGYPERQADALGGVDRERRQRLVSPPAPSL